MMDPQLKALAEKYSVKLQTDPFFSLRVKTLYKVMLVLDPNRDPENTKAEAYVLACVLEETHDLQSPGYPGVPHMDIHISAEARHAIWQATSWD
jgi:hypothetical protein